jgi:hypothetical protein
MTPEIREMAMRLLEDAECAGGPQSPYFLRSDLHYNCDLADVCSAFLAEHPADDETAGLFTRLDALTDDERLSVIGAYCEHCGRKHGERRCQCWNDE